MLVKKLGKNINYRIVLNTKSKIEVCVGELSEQGSKVEFKNGKALTYATQL